MAEKLGIVYTPVEAVDFIIRSVNDVLKAEFGKSLASENVNILDPFTGTGTFITRLLQSGLIAPQEIKRKYCGEIFANEIVLLAYYIAAVNIENAYHDVTSSKEYMPFEGVCLTDTFQLGEAAATFGKFFPANSSRLNRQRNAPITVIISNPPYSVGQRSANDNAQNAVYTNLDAAIAQTYAKLSDATNKNALYDSYIRAFRWATDRLGNENGIISFISNGAWLDGNSTAGFRKSLEQEFSKIYVFNLRGNARTSGELRRKEAGNIFDSGARTPIAITLLVKRAGYRGKAKIHYRDIGDYLTREQKLTALHDAASFLDPAMPKMERLSPNDHGDWIVERNDAFAAYIPLASGKKFNEQSESVFITHSNGYKSNRDTWVYNYSKNDLRSHLKEMVEFYNSQIGKEKPEYNPQKISWVGSTLDDLKRRRALAFEEDRFAPAVYRPFNRQWFYFGERLIERHYQMDKFFPTADSENLLICVNGVGGSKDFSCLISDTMIDVQCVFNGQCFPLYYYIDNPEKAQTTLFDDEPQEKYIRKDAVSDWIVKRAREQYGTVATKEDIFYYVYGYLHGPAYREKFSVDLKKSLPRIPLAGKTEDFWKFSKAGRELAKLHLHYEDMPPLETVAVKGDKSKCRVSKMRFLAKDRKDTILFNEHIRIENIPAIAYDYVVNGRSAIEWIMERYQVKTDKESGIVNDPNLWCDEHSDPQYILNLLLSIIAVSVKTAELVQGLPVVTD